jgi:hypothetical protein
MLTPRDERWGNVEIGDKVTSHGHHGAGQPPIAGELVSIDSDKGIGRVHIPNRNAVTGKGYDVKYRSLANLRKDN